MATNLEIIGDALRLINVISEVATPSAEQGTHGLRRLNALMESWVEDGIELGWFTQDSTTDDCPILASSERAVVAMLATDLATTYGASVSPELGVMAQSAYSTLLRNNVRDQMAEADMTHMPLGEGQYNRGKSILTDE
jgi:hypothetical protein